MKIEDTTPFALEDTTIFDGLKIEDTTPLRLKIEDTTPFALSPHIDAVDAFSPGLEALGASGGGLGVQFLQQALEAELHVLVEDALEVITRRDHRFPPAAFLRFRGLAHQPAARREVDLAIRFTIQLPSSPCIDRTGLPEFILTIWGHIFDLRCGQRWLEIDVLALTILPGSKNEDLTPPDEEIWGHIFNLRCGQRWLEID
ncbi:MAG: hypothetical protein QME88_11510, partial [Actinomycetota bacterium]|nr:hypothetical protein [Actinomycetota bacterium]